jgi:hypothetical protein
MVFQTFPSVRGNVGAGSVAVVGISTVFARRSIGSQGERPASPRMTDNCSSPGYPPEAMPAGATDQSGRRLMGQELPSKPGTKPMICTTSCSYTLVRARLRPSPLDCHPPRATRMLMTKKL